MKCRKHSERDAVAQCAQCGSGVCAECAERTEITVQDKGVLCVDCYRAEVQKIYAESRRVQRRKKIFIGVASVLYVCGLVFGIVGFVQSSAVLDKVVFCIIGAILCGFFTAVEGWRSSAGAEVELREGNRKGTVQAKMYGEQSCLARIIVFLFCAVLGVIITPIAVVRGVKIIKQNKEIEAGAASELQAIEYFE